MQRENKNQSLVLAAAAKKNKKIGSRHPPKLQLRLQLQLLPMFSSRKIRKSETPSVQKGEQKTILQLLIKGAKRWRFSGA